MRCWVFNEEQLDRALQAWVDRGNAATQRAVSEGGFGVNYIALAPYVLDFLRSPEAQEHKLILQEKR